MGSTHKLGEHTQSYNVSYQKRLQSGTHRKCQYPPFSLPGFVVEALSIPYYFYLIPKFGEYRYNALRPDSDYHREFMNHDHDEVSVRVSCKRRKAKTGIKHLIIRF